MKTAPKLTSSVEAAPRSKNNRVRLEKLLRQMLYTELAGARAATFAKSSSTFVPYRRVIE